MLTNQIFDDYCRNHDGLCFISFLPDVRDSGEEKRKEYLAELKDLSETGRGANFNFLWVQGGNNYDFEEKFQLGFGFPSLIAMHFGKNKYAIMRAQYNKKNLNQFIDDLRIGKVTVYDIPAQVPKLKEKKAKKDMKTEEL